jgi:hypothetical protein
MDDASDALDRRVEFKTIPCASPIAQNEKIDRAVRPTRANYKNGANPRHTDEDGALHISREVDPFIRRYLNSGGLRQLLDD